MYEDVDGDECGYDYPSLKLDGAGNPIISYYAQCAGSLRLARLAPRDAVLYRGSVADLSIDWKSTALPLTGANDNETPPFPVDTTLAWFAEDPIGTTAPLTLYRLLLDGTDHAGNLLLVVKVAGVTEIRF